MLIDDIENNLNYLIQEQNEKKLTLTVHPFVHAYITKGLNSLQLQWFLKYKHWVKVIPMKNYHLLEFRFYNKNGDELKG
jgi:ribonuclease G